MEDCKTLHSGHSGLGEEVFAGGEEFQSGWIGILMKYKSPFIEDVIASFFSYINYKITNVFCSYT